MRVDRLGQVSLSQLAGSQRHDGLDGIDLRRGELIAVDGKKEADGQEGHSLVAIHKRMIIGQTECIGRGQFRKGASGIVCVEVLRPGEGGVQ